MGERVWRGLSPARADGLACVVCAADYLTVATARRPVGRSETGSQVFACLPGCVERAARDGAMARWATVLTLLAADGPAGRGETAGWRVLLRQAALEAHGTPLLVALDEAGALFGLVWQPGGGGLR
jgi:hypothetical protein